MNTALATAVVYPAVQHHSYRGVDRAALRLALALVTWSRRARRAAPGSVGDRVDHQLIALEAQAAIEARDAVATKQLYQLVR